MLFVQKNRTFSVALSGGLNETINERMAMFMVAISGFSIGTVNAYEVGVEWTNDYGFWYNDPDEGWIYLDNLYNCDDLATGFYNRLGNDGWSKDFNWGDANAWEEDFKKESLGGTDYNWIDEVDFALYSGHGSPTGFYFNNDHDDRKLRGIDAHHDAEWGDLDLEWITLDACQVLNNTDEHGEWYERWGFDVFKGLHQIQGFDTYTDDDANRGEVFAGYMIDNEYTIKTSWFKACDDTAPQGVRAVVIGVCDEGYETWNDHLWGHGSVASDKTDPSCLFWAVHTV